MSDREMPRPEKALFQEHEPRADLRSRPEHGRLAGAHPWRLGEIMLTLSLLGCATLVMGEQENRPQKKAKSDPKAGKKVLSLFDGKTLKNWKSTEFGGEGKVFVENGSLVMDMGATLTGVTWKGPKLPKINYEVTLEAMRVEGDDFFCGLTFPVGKDPCSLIVGGWGGGIVGLSSLDGFDASENETTVFMGFEKKKWYPIRLRVTDKSIQAWIEKKQIVDVETDGREIGIRPEVELSRPFGFCAWQTRAALRKIKVRNLTKSEIESKKKP